MKVKICFTAANIILLAVVLWHIVPERLFVLQAYEAVISLRERQLEIREENLRMYEENIATIAALEYRDDWQIIIQPAGHIGALLTDVRNMLYARGLFELEFYASEQALHYLYGRHLSETRSTIVAEGCFYDINDFVKDITSYYRYLRLERIQISAEFELSRLWLTFSVYEEI